MKSIKILFLSLLVLFLALNPGAYPVYAQDLTAREMVKKSEDVIYGETNRMLITMEVLTPSWKREYRMQSAMKGRSKTVIELNYPLEKKGSIYLKENTQLWSYLPKVERKILIPPSSMLQPFLGSDFSYDDLVKASQLSKDYICSLSGEEDFGGEKTLFFELTPREEAAVVYGGVRLWLRKGDYVPLRQEFYDEKNNLIKTLDFSDIKPMGGHKIPTLWKMTNNFKQGRQTLIRISQAEFDLPIEDKVFSHQRL